MEALMEFLALEAPSCSETIECMESEIARIFPCIRTFDFMRTIRYSRSSLSTSCMVFILSF